MNSAPFLIYIHTLYIPIQQLTIAGIVIISKNLYNCDNHNGRGKAQDYEAHLSIRRTFP